MGTLFPPRSEPRLISGETSLNTWTVHSGPLPSRMSLTSRQRQMTLMTSSLHPLPTSVASVTFAALPAAQAARLYSSARLTRWHKRSSSSSSARCPVVHEWGSASSSNTSSRGGGKHGRAVNG